MPRFPGKDGGVFGRPRKSGFTIPTTEEQGIFPPPDDEDATTKNTRALDAALRDPGARLSAAEVFSNTYQPVKKGVIDRVSRHGEAYRGEGGFAILRDDEDDLNDQDGSSGRNKHEQGANSARHGLLRGAGADELAHQQR